MIYIEAIIGLMIGISVFLLGIHTMSDGLEKIASNKMRNIFSKISDNRLIGVGVGASVTAIIQSSTALSVMVVGFVNAGMMNLMQATAIIMGANIGTTITGLIIALDSFDIGLYLMLPTFFGVTLMLSSKKESTKQFGTIIAGIGLIFIGLTLMSGSINGVKDTEQFQSIFNTIRNPFLLIFIGFAVTAIVQSSSAVNGLVLALVVPYGMKNGLNIVDAVYVILGTNVGTCITALIASVGTNTNAKRASMLHFLFNIIGTILFACAFVLMPKPQLANFLETVFGKHPKFQIAWFNFFQNLICTIIMIPFIDQIVRLATFLVKEKNLEPVDYGLTYLDDRFLSSPSIAITQATKEIILMAKLAKENLEIATTNLITNNNAEQALIYKNEEQINKYNIGISNFLIKISTGSIAEKDEKLVSSLFHVISDIERIGEHAINLIEYADKMVKENNLFTEESINELKAMNETITSMYELTIVSFEKRTGEYLREISRLEDKVDNYKRVYIENHISRLNNNKCSVESGMIFYGIINNLERVADHLLTIAFSVKK